MLALLGCEGEGVALDGAVPDGAALDAVVQDAAVHDAELDAEPDAQPDAEPAAARPEVVALEGAGRLLPGASLRFEVPPMEAGEVVLWVAATLWRVEDGYLQLSLGDGAPQPVRLGGDARGWPAVVGSRVAFDGVGPGARPLAVPFAPPRELVLTAEGGVLEVHGAWLATPGALPPMPAEPAVVERAPLVVAPCGVGCDDGAALTAALAAAPEGPVEVQLAGAYHLQTAWRIDRPDVRVQGPATVHWAPSGAGPVAALDVRGRGPVGEAMPVGAAVAEAAHTLTVVAPPEWAPSHVRFEADDFGEVPPSCVNGRDVERFDRHIGRLFAVLDRVVGEGTVTVVLDRPVHLAVPAAANPRLRAVELLPGFEARGLHLLGDCPEALAYDGTVAAQCENEALHLDDGLALRWAVGAQVRDTQVQAFGRFALGVYDSLGTRLEDNRMDHPTSYGGGGRGYGVHLIRATRSAVINEQVQQARHGVVIDFGSTESQVLGGRFERMNQATIDVHGESSRDTLVRDVTASQAPTGVIVGGGGFEVHCNDGPRHHIESSRLETAVGVWVADSTREVFLRGVVIEGSRTAVTLFSGGSAALSDSWLSTLGPPFLLVNGGPLAVARTVFARACDQAAAAVGGAVDWGAGNVFCPEPAEDGL